MCDTCHIILKELREMKRDFTFLKTLINHNAGAAIQAKYVSKEEAMAITGLKQTALMEKQVSRDKEHGVFRTTKTGKKIRFYLRDLENYVRKNSTIDHPLPNENVYSLKQRTAS